MPEKPHFFGILRSHGRFLICMGTLYREATSIFVFTTLFNGSKFLKKNIITHLGFFPFKSRPFLKGLVIQGCKKEVKNLFPFIETANEHACVPTHLNSTSISMSKWRRYYVKIRHVTPTSKQRQFDVNRLRIYAATSK